MKHYILTLLLLSSLTGFAQKLFVESFSLAETDLTAQTSPRKDNNDINCALVKVQFVGDIDDIEGNVVKPWTRKGNETWVYMTQRSRQMQIKTKDYLPLMVTFADYGVSDLESNRTYVLTLLAQSTSQISKQQVLNIKVTPKNATVLIDGDIVEGNNSMVSVGSHSYNIAAKGYFSQSGTIEVKENQPAKLLIELDKKTSTDNDMIQNTSSQGSASIHQSALNNYSAKPQTFLVNGVTFEMVPVQGGTFTMGATSEQDSDAQSDEGPIHQVTLNSYYIGKTEVTQALWQAVMESNPSFFKGDNLPVEEVTWNECQTFISKLDSLTDKHFRLPTEAEWEFAARGGNKSRGYKYSGSNNIDDVAWCSTNSGKKTHSVGTKSPNELGLYDMSGNVWEWCSDWYGRYRKKTQTNPTGVSHGDSRVVRGGDWYFIAKFCRPSNRHYGFITAFSKDNQVGLRLVLSE